MNKLYRYIFLFIVVVFCADISAQEYANIVQLEDANDKTATFITIGTGNKKTDAEINALGSLFNTLFFIGVEGINDGNPMVTNNKPDYIKSFMANKTTIYGSNRSVIGKIEKNIQKKYEAKLRVTVPMSSLSKELAQNGLSESLKKGEIENVDDMNSIVLPSIMVVPYKKDGESYDAILQNDYDRRVAVGKLQAGFEGRNITTVDISAKIAAIKRRSEYEASTADSNDKQLLLTSGADVYVVVDLKKDIQPSGSRVSLIMKAYETSSGSILASQDGFTRKFNTSAVDMLCSYAVEDNVGPFLDEIVKNLNKQVTDSKRIVLQISIAGSSMMSMSSQVGPNNYRLSDVIRQWVRSNSDKGKYHLQGVVEESMIFDYVMIPLKDSDGLMMDAAQYGFLLQYFLSEKQNVSCSNKIDGNTVYITIE